MAYTDQQILDRLREHLIDKLGSVWTMHKPSWQGVQKRMAKYPDFEEEVRDIVAEANYQWEKRGIDALLSNDEKFNVTLFKHYTQNKKAFLSHEVLVIDERLEALEKAYNEKSDSTS